MQIPAEALASLGQPFLTLPKVDISELTSDEFIRRYQQPGVPVILTGLLDPAWDWSLEYLCNQLGDRPFLLRRYGKERYQQDKRTWTTIGSGVPPESRSFSDYAQLLRSHEAHEQDIYLAKCAIQDTPLTETEAYQSIVQRLAQIGFTRPASRVNLWVGPSGHLECLHYDPTDGTLIQLHGEKRVVLFPPSQTRNLYPYPVYVQLWHGMRLRAWFSQVYPDRPDFQAFPRLREAMRHRYDFVLKCGEALYIPAGWWHEVTALRDAVADEMVCSINRFWCVPVARGWRSWARWRAFLGSVCALPVTGLSLIQASFSGDRQQQIKEILQMF
ncbi:cupin-like domain-containing protein [Phormidium tenue FACHB-886]|nr:cupin-like domain-containing protein [Phormidium tenue FACHB-886]